MPPTGAGLSYLESVSCASGSACTAVGYVQKGHIPMTLAERWNGKRWSIQRTTTPAGPKVGYLTGVSCASSSACTAVGYVPTSTGAVTLAERWDGRHWSIEHTPNPAGAEASNLVSVSCASADACTAAGFFSNSAGTHLTLAERWSG